MRTVSLGSSMFVGRLRTMKKEKGSRANVEEEVTALTEDKNLKVRPSVANAVVE